jgi:hypothetical protein
MKNCLLAGILLPVAAFAQLNVSYNINTSAGLRPISPYIYGMCNGGYNEATIRRQGGNRMTGYIWENNASHAGADYFHQNDNYLPWVMGIPSIDENNPGIVTTTFHNNALAAGAMSAVTLQMAGYVARDKNGTSVDVSETAPSNRWVEVANTKPGPFVLFPDLNDDYVYMDEYMNFLINEFGNSTAATGINAYNLDNEAGLWMYTHPRIYPGPISIADHLNKSLSLARRVRQMDANALIFGPESYGYGEYRTFQDASDWSNYSGNYSHFLAAYLDSMAQASTEAGARLLDVFSVHWYPDVYAGSIYSTNTSPAIAAERMQVPRSLWDSTYVENGWIGQWFSQDLPILPKLKSLINTYYPGTALSITEYDYGGDAHISGGIAQAEALGAFARTGTEYATKWGTFSDYSLSAIRLYRDVAQPFGNMYTWSNSADRLHSNVFASINGSDDSELHFVVTNKDTDSTIQATFNITSGAFYDEVTVYSFNSTSPTIQTTTASGPGAGAFTYTLQPLTVYHFVLKDSGAGVKELTTDPLLLFPNPSSESVTIAWGNGNLADIVVTDLAGNELLRKTAKSGLEETMDVTSLAAGTYFIRKGGQMAVFVRK